VGSAAAEAARAEHAATHNLLNMPTLSGCLDSNGLSDGLLLHNKSPPPSAQLAQGSTASPPAAPPRAESCTSPSSKDFSLQDCRAQAVLHETWSTFPGSNLGSNQQHVPLSPRFKKSHSMDLQIGVLHYSPSREPFPLLSEQQQPYTADTYDLNDPEERDFWLSLLAANVPSVVEKACLSGGAKQATVERRAKAMGSALTMHFERLKSQPELYGPMGLSEIFDLREACLREFKFQDIHMCAPAGLRPLQHARCKLRRGAQVLLRRSQCDWYLAHL
jgi:hypothetical protein